MSFGAIVSEGISRLAEKSKASVVQISSGGRGAGAGIIWSADGAILTNYHVVAGAGRALQVLLPDNRLVPGSLIAHEAALDLALVRVDAHSLPTARVGDSSRLRVGDWVAAIGHPWGHRCVVTAGIVSALGVVALRGTERYSPYIRSNVALAPGNSGGPLLDACGAVVGINSMIFGGDLAISIPSHVASDWLAQQQVAGAEGAQRA